KFTDKGTISLSYVQDKQKRMVRFVVEDTGCGVEEKDKELIFNRFYKVDNFTQGIGLGLPIAQKIMALVDGTIFLDTSYQQGARFVVEWPFEITTKCPCVHTL
ncbi:MAG: HAMP domain-containing sensor histidine kinase, partial [Bacteroidaceae bacterium]